MSSKILTLSIEEIHEAFSIEQLLKKEFHLSKKEISRAKFQEKGICLNGKKARVNQKVKAGDYLVVSFEEKEEASNILLPEERLQGDMLEVLYEDEDVLVVNKPPMIPTQPTGRHAAGSLCNLVYARALLYEKNPQVRPVGRLDLETSGAVVFAKNQIAAAHLSSQREEGFFEKIYYAFVSGKLQKIKGKIEESIGPAGYGEGRDRIKMQVRPDGKTAVTLYEVVMEYEEYSLVRLRLKTGRTHQIRVHMSWLGHPLLGDQLYGDRTQEDEKKSGQTFQRAALHAGEVRFRHPFTQKEVCVVAPFPEDFCGLERNLRLVK